MRAETLHPAIVAAFVSVIPDAARREAIIAAIRDDYAAPERHYHNLRHLGQLVRALETVRGAIADWNLLMLAAAYHDVIYDSARPDNEEASAARAGRELQPYLNATRSRQLEAVILATKHHEASADTDTNLFCDADLAILGASPADYDAYAAQIRAEYDRYPDERYKPGRAAVLQKLLDQPELFKTGDFRHRLEPAARTNIARELSRLGT